MNREVIVLDADVAIALSDVFHRIEKEGFNLTEFEDEIWEHLTSAINQKARLEP